VRVALVVFVLGIAVTACKAAEPASVPLPRTEVTDIRYKGLVFLVATVRQAGADFVITNDSTQPWLDVTLVIVGAGTDEYRFHLSEIDAGQSVTAPATQFASSGGVAFNAERVMPRTLIVSAEIGEGGPTGIYAVRL